MIFNYRLNETEVQVRIGSWVVRRIRLDDIETAAVRPRSEILWTWNEHWPNVSPQRFVVLRRKSGLARTFVFNPPDPEGFLADLATRIS